METQELVAELENATRDYLGVLEQFSADLINIVPFEGSWTGGQVTEHLLLSESDLPGMLVSDNAPANRPSDQFSPTIAGIFLDFSTKLKAPAFNIPSSGPHNLEKLTEDFTAERAAIAEIARNEDLTLLCNAFPFPTVGELTRYEWIYFVICHSKRHVRQLRNILEKVTIKVAG